MPVRRLLLLCLLACADGIVTEPARIPQVLASAIERNPNNVLSAIVTVHARRADSVAVRYGVSAALDSMTPAVSMNGDFAFVPVLGLLPRTAYTFQVLAYGHGQTAAGTDTLAFATDALPSDLPRYVASGSDPSPGYVVFGAGMYGLIIDNTGRVVWYQRFTNGPGLNFEVEPNGHYFARPTTPDPTDFDPWIEIDPLGNVVRAISCIGELEPRFHDLIAERDGGYWTMCDDVRTMDLSSYGGRANANVTGTVIQHVSATGALLMQWSAFDHFDIVDLDSASRSGTAVNWTHANAMALDTDGNLIVSFRNLNEITKINAQSGDVMWRMGGMRNEFAFQNMAAPAFAFQHALRVTGAGQFVILDNMGNADGSHAEQYAYDADRRTARLLSSYGPTPPVVAQTGGSVQSLPGLRTLVSMGPAGRVEEYDAAGNVVWRIEGNPGYVFRAQRIRSLYHPERD
ncbi:MAG TPA: arylsulfotransferase family protein [Gemmatimonadaceae bacterium]|nr:arylsulfotransferase family protein [Gemmatimonadaceae bacterium]